MATLNKDTKKIISKLNARLKSIYKTFGEDSDLAINIREDVSKVVKLKGTKKNKNIFSTSAKDYDPNKYDIDTLEDTFNSLDNKINTVSIYKKEAKENLQDARKQDIKAHLTPRTITDQDIINEVNAISYVTKLGQSDRDLWYEIQKAYEDKAGSLDQNIDAELGKLFQQGYHWTKTDLAFAYKQLIAE